jgi:hypothetical protein
VTATGCSIISTATVSTAGATGCFTFGVAFFTGARKVSKAAPRTAARAKPKRVPYPELSLLFSFVLLIASYVKRAKRAEMQQAEATASEIAKSNRKARNGRQTHAPPDGARQSAVSDAQLNVVTRACTHKRLMSAFGGKADIAISKRDVWF